LAAAVVAALRQRCPALHIEGIGGPALAAQGLVSAYPLERLSVMGLIEPLRRLPELLRLRARLARQWRALPPDLFLGIDAPDFNLGLERSLRRASVPTAHLVSPTLWAWRPGRIRTVVAATDLMLTLFPFETAIYQQHAVPVVHVGHPLADTLQAQPDTRSARRRLGLPAHGLVLAVLPGSRAHEVAALAPDFLRAARLLRLRHPDLQILIPAANAERYAELAVLQQAEAFADLPISLLHGDLLSAVGAADAVLAASGTATLEVMLLGRPMVIAYRLRPLSHAVLSRLVRTPWVGLPNILAGRRVVPELLQDAATPDALAEALDPLLRPGPARNAQLETFAALADSLRGGAAERAADALLDLARRPRA